MSTLRGDRPLTDDELRAMAREDNERDVAAGRLLPEPSPELLETVARIIRGARPA